MPIDPISRGQMIVQIDGAAAAAAPVSITAFAFDADGAMTVTLSDGTVLPTVPCASMLAAALGGKYLVVADDAGNLFANGKQISPASAS